MLYIGIPRALYYYKYYSLWKTFFEELGAKVVVSETTNKKILLEGISSCICEACLPVKAYFGHAVSLFGKVDYIFIPRFTSVSRDQYICPQLAGLPDMIRNTFKICPRIIDTEINLRSSPKNAIKAALNAGSYITTDRRKIRRAFDRALAVYQQEREVIKCGIIPFDDEKKGGLKVINNHIYDYTICIIGHHYNVYDNYLNMQLIKKLKMLGAGVITLDMLDYKLSKVACNELNKKLYWDFGTRAYGGVVQLINKNAYIDGVIILTSYGCGVDSFVDELVQSRLKSTSKIPYMKLTLDEHSADTGMMTRIEAFIDMLTRRKANGIDISSYR